MFFVLKILSNKKNNFAKRALNEKISLSVGAGSPEGPGLVQPMPHSIERMSPPPENKAMSQLTSVTTQPLREDSSGSERGL